jgi:hypothetical protein
METVRQRTAQPGPVIRVIKGHAGAEELAALTAALLLRAGADTEPTAARGHRPATWRRLERALNHRGARSWREEAAPRMEPKTAAGA